MPVLYKIYFTSIVVTLNAGKLTFSEVPLAAACRHIMDVLGSGSEAEVDVI